MVLKTRTESVQSPGPPRHPCRDSESGDQERLRLFAIHRGPPPLWRTSGPHLEESSKWAKAELSPSVSQQPLLSHRALFYPQSRVWHRSDNALDTAAPSGMSPRHYQPGLQGRLFLLLPPELPLLCWLLGSEYSLPAWSTALGSLHPPSFSPLLSIFSRPGWPDTMGQMTMTRVYIL
jgi:hypothetical protein